MPNNSKQYRYYQQDCDNAICEELTKNDKCIVKMFCGTGKSLIMRNCKILQNRSLIVYVFPSLSLIDQFCTDYLNNLTSGLMLKISSEVNSTTDLKVIKDFLKNKDNKIVCITYQSFDTLLSCLGKQKINVCIFDEAHHAVGETYQQSIFGNTSCEKQIFFTATPKNANGIIMYENDKVGDCGKLVYEYNYLRGVQEGYLNKFEIRLDMFTENTNYSLYESIARAILTTGNNRVLTFHSDVNTERDTSVNKFVNQTDFLKAYEKVVTNEFPANKKHYKSIKFIALDASIKPDVRRNILNDFDKGKNNEIFIIASCATIGEGVDTKNSNMVVFVDPKESHIKIIQNIGRAVRKQFGINRAPSTILLPCWVDKNKYQACNGDREKCDEAIRVDMSKTGNFNSILNTLAALKCEDPELYDLCVNYANSFSPKEINDNLRKHHYKTVETEEPTGLVNTLEDLLEVELNDEYLNMEDEEILNNVAENNDVCIEVHGDSFEEPIKKYNEDSTDIIRLYKKNEINEEGDDEISYNVIVKEDDSKRNRDIISTPVNNRCKINVHTSQDVKILWNIAEGFDIGKNICNCIIDCEVKDMWYENHNEFIKYINQTNKRPLQADKDIRICRLGAWINTQCKNLRKNIGTMLDMKKRALIEDILKRDCMKTDAIIWSDKFNQCVVYGKIHNKLPSYSDKDYAIKRLGAWVCNQTLNYKNNVKMMTDINRRTQWETFIELGYIKNLNIIWRDKCLKCIEYVETHSKSPSSSDKSKDVKSLGVWIGNQNKNYEKNVGIVSEVNNKKLFEKLLGYDCMKNFNAMWYDSYAKTEIYMTNQKGKPPSCAKDPEVKKLGIWLDLQIRNYKLNVKAMKDLDKREKLEQLIRNNSEYFQYSKVDFIMKLIQDSKEKPAIKYTPDASVNSSLPQPKKSMKLKLKAKAEDKVENVIKHNRERIKTEISELHKRYKTMNSTNLHNEFVNDTSTWFKYHDIAAKNEEGFPEHEIPRNRIIAELGKIKQRAHKNVVDLGCGLAQIAKQFKDDPRFTFTNIDHVACDENVISGDISNTKLEAESYDIAILSLAMWGSNCREYIKEAHRILDEYSLLYIIEPTKRWSEKDDEGDITPGKEAIRLKNMLEENGFKIVCESIEKFCMFTCVKV